MKLTKLLALLFAFALIAAACGDSDDGDGDAASGGTTATTAAPADTGDTTATTEEEMDETDDTTATTEEEMDETEGMAGQGGELLLLQWQAPSIANPYLSTGGKDILAASIVLEPLVKFDPDGNVITALASEVPSQSNGGIPDDLMSITYTLIPGVLWSDGTPLTADDVVFSWEYCTDELTGCSSSGFVSVVDVVADDDLTVTINFDSPQPYPFVPFAGTSSAVIQRAQFQNCVGDEALQCSDENFMPVGTGPYMVTELRPEDTVLYEYNPLYRKAAEGKPFFTTVQIKGGGDAEAAARSVLEIGEADYAWNLQVAPEIIGPMADAGNGEVFTAFTANVEHINLNQTDPDGDPPSDYNGGTNPNPLFFENPELSRALSMAINRDELVAVGYGPSGTPTCNFWPVGSQNSTNNDWCLTQDIDGANAILDGLGYMDTDGDGIREADGTPLSWDYVTSTNAVRQSNQDLIKSYWEEIGVEANMRNEDASLFFDGSGASPVNIWSFFTDIEMFTNGPSGPDAAAYLSGFLTEQIPESTNNWSGDNIVRLASDEFDALHAQLASTPLDDPNRDALVIELNDIIVNGPVIPLIFRGSPSAFSNEIQGHGALNGWDSEYYNIEDWFRAE
ncbi:peptide ABC transporter substrate-binding protein [Acidimicrobiaceae bacterium AH-315-P05]|nr:peptide ABC transporter substrate-binding protein [Acidimicrobiaceae bacterium AH-315-P05]